MREAEKALVVLVVVALVGVGGYLAYQKVSPKVIQGQSVVSESKVNVADRDGDGTIERGEVTGYWVFNLAVNQRDEIEFTVGNVSEEVESDLSKGVPPGSEIRTGSKVSAIFSPAGPPYISGPVKLLGYSYDDHGYLKGGGWHRIYKFYALGYPEWHVDGRHAPYEVTVKKGGSIVSGPETYVSGVREGWDTAKVDLPYGMEIRQFAQLTNGLVIPTKSYAYYWVEKNGSTDTKLSKFRDVHDTLRAGYHNTTTIESGLFDVIDKWPEVTSGGGVTGGDWIPTLWDLEERVGVKTRMLEGVRGVPSDVTRFTTGVPSLWSEKVPHDTDTRWGSTPSDTFVEDPTEYTAIRALPGASVTANLLFKVPASVFESYLYKPPYGIAKIVDKFAPQATEGQRNLVGVEVKNTGPTGDTFTAEMDYPGTSVEEGPGRISIPAGETRDFQWVVSRPSETEVGKKYDVDFTVTVEAINSGKSETGTFSQEWAGGEGGPEPGYGSVVGEVVGTQNQPIAGASVSCGGKFDVTGQNGTFKISGIGSGSQKLTADAKGYESKTVDVMIKEGEQTNLGRIVLGEVKEEGLPWLKIAIAGAIGGAIIIAVALYYYTRRRKRR